MYDIYLYYWRQTFLCYKRSDFTKLILKGDTVLTIKTVKFIKGRNGGDQVVHRGYV